MQIHLIIGPTGIGKTSRAVQLARKSGAPVLVLDRIQIYPALSIGSGRPSLSELRGTVRHYLIERDISDGDLPADEALTLLREHTVALAQRERRLILEGGSISLVRAIWESDYLRGYQVQITCLSIHNWTVYRQMVYRRVLQMLSGYPSITDELALIWAGGNSAARALVGTIAGYNALLAWCEESGVSPRELPSACRDVDVRAALASAITQSHLDYADRQQAAFADLQRTHASFAKEIAC